MIREAIDAVANNAVAKASPQARVYQPPFFPRTHYLVTTGDGVETREIPPGPIRDQVGHFPAVAAWVAAHYPPDADTTPVVWYDRTGVTVVGNPFDRGDTARLSLPYTKPMQWLIDADKRPLRLTQAELVRLLKTTLAGVAPVDLLGKVKVVKVEKHQQAEGVIDRGKVSVARSMLTQGSGVDDLPDEVRFFCQVHESSELSTAAVVRAAFDLDPTSDAGHFLIDVLPGEVERALADAEAEIGSRLLSLFAGDPLNPPAVAAPTVIRGTPSV